MPKIPDAPTGSEVSTRVPGVSFDTSAFGAVGEALASFGAKGAQIATQLQQQRTNTIDIRETNEALEIIERDANRAFEEFQRGDNMNADGTMVRGTIAESFGKNFSEAMDNFIKIRREAMRDQLSHDSGRVLWDSKIAPYEKQARIKSDQQYWGIQKEYLTTSSKDLADSNARATTSYEPTANKSRLMAAEEQWARFKMGIKEQMENGNVSAEWEDSIRKYGGHQQVNNQLKANIREEEFSQIGTILGRTFLTSREAKEKLKESLNLTGKTPIASRQIDAKVDELFKILTALPPEKLASETERLNQEKAVAKITNELYAIQKKGNVIYKMPVDQKINNQNAIHVYMEMVKSSGSEAHDLEQYLTPAEKESYFRQTLNAIESKAKKGNRALMDRIENIKAMYQSGDTGLEAEATGNEVMNQILASPNFEEFEKANEVGEILASFKAGKFSNEIKLMPIDRANRRIENLPNMVKEVKNEVKKLYPELESFFNNPEFSKKFFNKVQNSLREQYKGLRYSFAKDGAAYLIEHDPKARKLYKELEQSLGNMDEFSVQGAIENFNKLNQYIVEKQQYLGQPEGNIRHIPKFMSDRIKFQLNQFITNKEKRGLLSSYLDNFQAIFGKDADAVFNELEDDNTITPEMNFARNMPIYAVERSQSFTNIVNSADIKKSVYPGILDEDFERAIRSNPIMVKLGRSILPGTLGNNTRTWNGILGTIKLEIQRRWGEAQLQDLPSDDHPIVQDVISNFHNKFNHSHDDDSGAVTVPVRFMSEYNIPESYVAAIPETALDNIMDPKIRLYVPESFRQGVKPFALNEADIQKRYKKMIVDDEKGKVRNNRLNNGIQIMVNDVPIMELDKNNVPIPYTRSWKEVLTDPKLAEETAANTSTEKAIRLKLRKIAPRLSPWNTGEQ